MKIRRTHIYLFIWISLITYALLTPGETLPDLILFPHFDKVIHFIMFSGLSLLIVPVIVKQKKYIKAYTIAFIISTVTGIIFELLQSIITYDRSSSIYDALANTTGALIGILIYQLIIRNKMLEKLIF